MSAVANKKMVAAISIAMLRHVFVVDASQMMAALAVKAQGSSVEETILAIDTNKNGKVDEQEISTFARNQGLDPQDVMGDFHEIDANGDGELDFSEISKVLQQDGAKQGSEIAPQAGPVANTVPLGRTASVQDDSIAFAPTAFAAAGTKPSMLSSVVAKPVAMDSSLELASVQQNVKQQAGRIVATNFASRAQNLMMQSAADDKLAASYIQQARQLRGKATQLLHDATTATERAASQAASRIEKTAKSNIEELQAEIQKIEREAAQQRIRAHQAKQSAAQSQLLLKKFLQLSPA